MNSVVVDASVLVEIFVAGEHAANALSLLEQASLQRLTLHAPDALYYEVASALRRHELRSDYPSIEEDIADLFDLDIAITPSKSLLFDAVEIARSYQLSIYDAFYLALAQRLQGELVTADRRLVNGVLNKPFRVVHVADLALP